MKIRMYPEINTIYAVLVKYIFLNFKKIVFRKYVLLEFKWLAM